MQRPLILSAADLPPCDALHESQHSHGWVNYGLTYVDGGVEIEINHTVPCGDLRQHKLDLSCWCEPVEVEPFHIVHSSADGRETYERGEREHH